MISTKQVGAVHQECDEGGKSLIKMSTAGLVFADVQAQKAQSGLCINCCNAILYDRNDRVKSADTEDFPDAVTHTAKDEFSLI